MTQTKVEGLKARDCEGCGVAPLFKHKPDCPVMAAQTGEAAGEVGCTCPEPGARRTKTCPRCQPSPQPTAQSRSGLDLIEATATGKDGTARRVYVDRAEGKVYEIAQPPQASEVREKIVEAIYANVEITGRASLMGTGNAADAILAALPDLSEENAKC